MVALYADLVELGFRVLEEEEGKIAVPMFLRADVAKEIERRKNLNTY